MTSLILFALGCIAGFGTASQANAQAYPSASGGSTDVIARIKAGGYDVFVVLEATIGFNQHDADEAESSHPSTAEFHITPQDLKFLKSLRIRVEDE